MTKRPTGPGFPKLKPKKYPSPHKDVPVLTKKMPDRPRKSTRGSKYRPASLATFHTGERIIANAENQKKRTGPKMGMMQLVERLQNLKKPYPNTSVKKIQPLSNFTRSKNM